MKNVLLGCTGSVASIKIPEILEKLKENPEISVKLGKFIHTDILIFHSVEFKINLLAQLQLLHKILFFKDSYCIKLLLFFVLSCDRAFSAFPAPVGISRSGLSN